VGRLSIPILPTARDAEGSSRAGVLARIVESVPDLPLNVPE